MQNASLPPLVAMPSSTVSRLIACAIVLLVNASLMMLPYTEWTYDAQTHMLLASHYQDGWFAPVEDRWHGGFCVWSYPALVHQTIALLGDVVGIETGYRMVHLAALIALPMLLGSLAGWFAQDECAAGWATILTPFLAGPYLTGYCFGQITTLVGIALSLSAALALAHFLCRGGVRLLLIWLVLLGAATCAHHFSVLLVLPLLSVAIVCSCLLRCRQGRKAIVVRSLLAAAAAALAIATALAPFWWWFFHERLPQRAIPHPSRDGLFQTPLFAAMFFWNLYGGALVYLAFGVAMTPRCKRTLAPLWGMIVLLFVLGLGFYTPLPKVLYGQFAGWLTYDRFTLWAGLLSVIPAGAGLSVLRSPRRRTMMACIMMTLSVPFVALAAAFSQSWQLLPTPLKDWETQQIAAFLDSDQHDQWHYVTFGVGDANLARISRSAKLAKSLDGCYFTGRTNAELSESGVGTLDFAALSSDRGRALVRDILEDPERWNLQWAIAVSWREINSLLKSARWVPLQPIGGQPGTAIGDAIPSTLWIWMPPNDKPVPCLARRDGNAAYPVVLCYLWGVMPLSLALAAVVLVAVEVCHASGKPK